MSKILVTKRNGNTTELDIDKIHNVVAWAAEELTNVSISQVVMKSQIQFYDKMKTEDIHKIIIKSAADLITATEHEYSILAARLNIIHIRKKAFNSFTPPHLLNHVIKMVKQKKYDPDILTDFTHEELKQINEFIDHSRDLKFHYAAVKQLEGKYLIQNRVTGAIYESPQFSYILIAACLFSKVEDKVKRLDFIKRFYDATSLTKISLPTPIMSGVRTPTRQFSSCVVIDCGDSLDSINATASSVIKYVSQRAGIGINVGRIRAIGSEIRRGEALHTGIIPFIKHFQTAVKSCSQGGVRGGAATLFYPIWHFEVENLLVLKNNRGVDENRVRHLDYGVQFNRLMYDRLIKGGNITLFSPSDVEGLYDAFFQDQDKFEKLYIKYEQDPSIRKKTVKAIDLFSMYAQERAGTGRIYLQNADHTNTHSPFIEAVAPIHQSNLCLEIALPTEPLNDINSTEGEIALCTLSAFNLGAIDDLSELEDLAELMVTALDYLIDYQDYPVKAAELSTKKRRPLGGGVINYANYLAKNGVKYSDGSANDLTHRTFEAIQFYLMKASMNLAKEKGRCSGFNETKLSKGILPIDTYKQDVDNLSKQPLLLDWDGLREDILKHGMRNSTVSALMPSETSSQISNATNGIEPPRGPVSVKHSKDGILKQVVPDIEKLGGAYEYLWDIPNNTGYIQLVAIMQKFIDQAISANTNYDPSKFDSGRVPMKTLLGDILMGYKYGLKTFYYHNTRDNSGVDTTATNNDDDLSCQGDSCKI